MKSEDKKTERSTVPLICLLSSVRNSARHLREWFEYHRAIGITRFYVIDHQPSQDDTSVILAEQPDAVIIRKRGPFNETRWSAELCNTAIRDGAQAIFPNDTDEFIAGNGAPFQLRVQEMLCRLNREGLSAIHLLTPGYNMFPSSDKGDEDDWRTHVLCRLNPLFTGKSAIFFSLPNQHVVINGCQHRLRLDPMVPATVRSDAIPLRAIELSATHFPFYYMHFPFHGPTHFLKRIQTFIQGPLDKVWQMATRYGEGIVDDERRLNGCLSKEDLQDFVAHVNNLRDGGKEIYRRAVLDAGLPRAFDIKTELADFFRLDVPRSWNQELLNASLDSFQGTERGGAGPFTEKEFVLWPVGALQLKRLEDERRQEKSAGPSAGEPHHVL